MIYFIEFPSDGQFLKYPDYGFTVRYTWDDKTDPKDVAIDLIDKMAEWLDVEMLEDIYTDGGEIDIFGVEIPTESREKRTFEQHLEAVKKRFRKRPNQFLTKVNLDFESCNKGYQILWPKTSGEQLIHILTTLNESSWNTDDCEHLS